ncbi:MAG: hypothetical protein IKL54_03630 [Bacteroidaceae bacterium]|nr:hypothetical protein [Bacteroidaceae bacterium]
MRFPQIAIFYALLMSLFLSACSDDTPVPVGDDSPLIEAGEEAQQLLFMYIVADNNLEGYAQRDLQEVLQASDRVPNDCYMLAFVDDGNNARVLRYFNNKGVGDYETVYNFGREVAACDTAEMRVLFDWMGQNYPAKSVDMILWSHATGWLHDDRRPVRQRSFGYDTAPGKESDCRRMHIEELAGFFKKRGIKLDRLMFDACFMQCAEVAYALRDCANWIIASPAEIPGYGAPYDALVPLFFDATATPLNIIDAYKTDYDGGNTGVVLSAVRCAAMQQFADATAVAVKKALLDISGSDCRDVFSYLPGGYFGNNGSFPNFFDMNSVMKKYLGDSDYLLWKNALDAALPYRCASREWYSEVLDFDRRVTDEDYIKVADNWCGISMYLPNSDSRFDKFNAAFTGLEWYEAAAWNEAE